MPSLGRCTIPNRSYHVSIAPRECYNAWGWYRVAAWLPHRCKKERQNDPWDEPCNCRHEIDHSPSQCLLPSKLPYRISIYTSLYTQESARALAARSRSLLGSHLDKRDLAFPWRVEAACFSLKLSIRRSDAFPRAHYRTESASIRRYIPKGVLERLRRGVGRFLAAISIKEIWPFCGALKADLPPCIYTEPPNGQPLPKTSESLRQCAVSYHNATEMMCYRTYSCPWTHLVLT